MFGNGFGIGTETGDYSTETSGSVSVENQLDSTENNLDSVENPTGNPTGSDRVFRGGSWGDDPVFVRTSTRSNFDPTPQDSDLGFRICNPPKTPPTNRSVKPLSMGVDHRHSPV